MSQTLTLELNDKFFAAIHQQAASIGIPPESLAIRLLEQQFSQFFKLSVTEAERERAKAKFERHFGAINFGIPTDLDNESIDADLAKEYANTHEDD